VAVTGWWAQASSDPLGIQDSTAAAARSARQVQGSSFSSSWALVRPETIRSSTSVSHAKGSTPFSFAVATRLATIAQCCPRVASVFGEQEAPLPDARLLRQPPLGLRHANEHPIVTPPVTPCRNGAILGR
jgi:hypothetical protein